jgi:hypothetical protein
MVLLALTTARADVLEQVPSDALVVFKVNNLKATSDKVAKLANDLGLAQMVPPMADPLGFLQQQVKMTNGVDSAGELAFAYLDADKFDGDDEKSFVVLIPVTDYQAFIGNWADAQTDGAVSQVKMGESDDPGFISNWGSYAALSANRDIVANKPANPGLKFPAVTTKELSGKDAILVANFKALGPKLQPKLRENREKILGEIEKEMANDPQSAKFAPVAKAVVGQMMNIADGFLGTSEAATFGLSLTNDGILASLVSEFQPDSYAGQLATNAKNTPDHKLAGIPAGKYLFFGGSVSDPESTNKCLDDLAQPILREVLAIGPEFKAAQDYYDGLKAYVGASTGSSIGLMAPSGALGAESLIQGVNIQRGNAKQMLEGYKKMMESQQALMTALGVPAEQMKISYAPNAKTVAGVPFDAMKSEFNFDPNDPSSAQAQQFMNMLYGPNGATVMLGVLDEKTLVQAIGLKDEATESVVAAAKGNLAPLADLPTVRAVSGNLPKNNMAVFYVPVDEIVNTGLNYAKQFGVPVQIQLPPDLPPVGAAFATEGSAMRADFYVPSQLVQSLVAAGMQAAMQMQGGGGGGGGGL